MSSAAKRKINLVLKEGFEFTTIGRLLTWALGVGRVIVILTELIVVIAFLSRFWLDRTLTDLNEANISKRKQIEASNKFETDFRAAQTRLSIYKKLTDKPTKDAAKVKKVASLLPQDVTLNKISLSQKDVSITGVALSEEGLAGFLKGLGKTEEFANIALSGLSLSTEGQQGFSFTLKGTMGGKN